MFKISPLYIFFIFKITTISLVGQSVISPNAYLSSAKNETPLQWQERKTAFLQTMSYQLPLIENVQFRTETDRFEFRRQEYLGRVSFNGFQEIKNQKRIKDAKLQLQEADKKVLLEDALLERYTLLIEYRHLENSIAANQKLLTLYQDKIAVLRKMAKLSPDFDIDALVKTEEDFYSLQQRLFKEEGYLKNIIQYIQTSVQSETGTRLDTSNWLPLSKIRQIALEILQNPTNNPLFTRQEAAIALRQSEYNLEKAQSQKILDFAQLRFSGRQDEPIRNELAVGIGIQIPYRGSTKIDLTEIELKRLDEEYKLKNLQYAKSHNLSQILPELALIFQQYDLIQRQIVESQAQFTLNQYAKIQGSQPLALLRMQEVILRRQAQLVDFEHDAFLKYLKLLNWSGKVAEMPLKNYLSVDLSVF
jgi:hypothetical protein